ncbi:receptor-like serine/threonine-protein kinase [Populus alba x Populus x berolinensis]|uniref:Receptor-like serine/threonine-protein kinase n=1 Tax=Populus alba x Populus x berolinensis TaxID=444605 RepID=A0AAD6Q482_9ROSI|nr:receptor-like serine/threonine-protein kinase [Populus alba x Populus x berolinensis]KAJ6978307.1 receptor-like serine/threonine-protein kinase [Populus alba x Populus x berolinensis]
MPSRPAPPFLPPQPSPLPYHQRSSSRIPPLAAASTSAFSFLLLFVICFRKLTRKRTVPTDFSKPPHRFSYTTLRRATNKFSPSLRLGQGGFGSVYHGTLPNELNVAVKVMDSGSLQGEREFQNELLFASKLDSCYIVTARGFSYRKCVELVDWKKRFSIAVDIAKGIEYLHSLDPPVIHGDIKPSNILLDQCFNAKVADFGLAWLKIDNSNHSTPSMRGNVCYAAPEYGGGGNLSEKSDVYSFGVLLLVLIAGRRPLQVTNLPMSEFQRANLMHWARNLARSGKLLDLVDKSVQSLDREQATLCITIALLCLQKSPAHRPSMKEVVGMLTGESQVPQLPSEFSPSPPTRFPFKSKSHQKVR